MNFKEAEKYLLSLINISRKEYMTEAKNCQIYLDRLNYFLHILGNPQNKIPHYIHITGTSGKGSETAYLHSILEAAGKKVGSMQSPHPTKITERWRIGSKNMSDKEFVNIVKIIKQSLEKYLQTSPYDMVSYNEIITAIGLTFFAKNKVEWAVIEVGMGGRFDSTNVIPNKDIAVITNIGIDHEELIGPTKKEITYEKAGIIKPKSKVFTMVSEKNLLNIIDNECKKNKAKLNIIKKNNYKLISESIEGTIFNYNEEKYKILSPGLHQINNAILAIEIARSLNIKTPVIKKALSKTKQIMRLEPFYKNKIILDGAHNEDKMKSTVDFIKKLQNKDGKDVHLLVGFSENKKRDQMIKTLSELKPKSVCITRNTVNPFRKVANPADIKKIFIKNGIKNNLNIFLEPTDAFNYSVKKIKKNDILLITGSIFLSGQLRPRLTKMK